MSDPKPIINPYQGLDNVIKGVPNDPSANSQALLDYNTAEATRPRGGNFYIEDPSGNPYKPFGSYDDYLRADQIQKYVRSGNQGFFSTAANGIIGAVGSTAAYIAETPFAFIGAAKGLATSTEGHRLEGIAKGAGGDNETINEIQSKLDQFKSAFPVHESRAYDEGNIIDKMGTTSWLFKDFADGAAFLASAYFTGKGITALLGDLPSISKAAEALSKAEGSTASTKYIAEAATKTFKALDQVGINTKNIITNVINTIFEAGQEANEAKSKSDAYYDAKIKVAEANGWLGDAKVLKQQKELVGDHIMASVFTTNYGILTLSNIPETKWINDSFGNVVKNSRNEIVDALGKVESSVWSAAGGEVGQGAKAVVDDIFKQYVKKPSIMKGFLQGVLAESLYEENTQAATQNHFYKKYVLGNSTDKDVFDYGDYIDIAKQSVNNAKAFGLDLAALPIAALSLGHIRAP